MSDNHLAEVRAALKEMAQQKLLEEFSYEETEDFYTWGVNDALVRKAREALAALSRIEQAGAWQPIATAPKDGTVIIVPGGIAHWHHHSSAEDGWYSLTAEAWPGRPINWPVKYWMPLPPPPAAPANREIIQGEIGKEFPANEDPVPCATWADGQAVIYDREIVSKRRSPPTTEPEEGAK